MIHRDDLPATPDWLPQTREAVDFSRVELKPACELCKQRLDGLGHE